MLWDIKTTASGTSQELALQTGSGFDFCSAGNFQFLNPNTTTTIDIDLATLDCGGGTVDLSQIHNFYIFLGNAGPDPIYLDNVRATTGAPPLYSFETSTQNWMAASFNSSVGTTEQSTDFATDGNFSLKITPTGGGWFGVEYSTPLSLAGKTHITWDLKTTGSGTPAGARASDRQRLRFLPGRRFPIHQSQHHDEHRHRSGDARLRRRDSRISAKSTTSTCSSATAARIPILHRQHSGQVRT